MLGSRYKVTGRRYQPDENVCVEDLHSKILKELYSEYSSVFHREEGDTVGEINFLNKDDSLFFSFHDSENPLFADVTKLTNDDRESMSEFFLYVPWLMCVYTAEVFRGQGKQKMIFNRIIELSEQTGESFYAVADPFVLNRRNISSDVRSGFESFYRYGHKRPDNWCELVKKQIDRFQKYGLQNFVLHNAELTEPFQHYIYCPSTASEDHKKVIATLLQDSPIECDKQLSKAG
jgi:hypothetical protein